jgi:hypothetical protein
MAMAAGAVSMKLHNSRSLFMSDPVAWLFGIVIPADVRDSWYCEPLADDAAARPLTGREARLRQKLGRAPAFESQAGCKIDQPQATRILI